MTEALTELAIFIPTGIFAWLLSAKFGIPGYGHQPIRKIDVLFIPLAFLLSAICVGLIDPWTVQVLLHIVPFIAKIQIFNKQFGLVVNLIGLIIVTDFIGYWVHRLLHTRWFWRFHALHHSPQSLNWLSGLFGSPVHFILILSGMTVAKVFFYIGESFPVILFMGLFNVIGQHITHSNIRLPYSDWLEKFIVTPRLHFVHHNPEEKFTNSNYGFYFSFWDYIFGTYQSPHSPDLKHQVGLNYEKSFSDFFIGKD